MIREPKALPGTENEKRRALAMAIMHFRLVEPIIADGLQAVLDDINHEQKLNDMRLQAGEGPSE